MIPNNHWNEEERDDEEHLAELQHHIEVSIDAESEHQEWILNQLVLVSRQVQSNVLHQRLSKSVLEIRLLHLVQAPFELRNNVINFGFIGKRVHVLDGHEHLVDLLLCQSIWFFPLTIHERLVLVVAVVVWHLIS